MTFSIAACCPERRMFGVAISSSSICVTSRCAFTRSGVGAALTQNVTDPSLGRIQVEHPVTELVTGVDLVAWQIRIAAGESLKIKQSDVKRKGCAIECRINAESPADNFRPCPGRIERFILPGGPDLRIDTHAHAGYVVSPYYDSMIAKLLVFRPRRADALIAMRRALDEFVIEPIKTTLPLHRQIFEHADFVRGDVDTGFIEREVMPRLREA